MSDSISPSDLVLIPVLSLSNGADQARLLAVACIRLVGLSFR
jgi:hypothetical protein